jgi:hypothetical protein
VFLSPEQRIPANHPLRAIRQMTDDALRHLSSDFAAVAMVRYLGIITPHAAQYPTTRVATARLSDAPRDIRATRSVSRNENSGNRGSGG